MDLYSALQYAVFVAIVTALVEPLGGYLERVFSRKPTVLDRLCLPFERLTYRLTAVNPNAEMTSMEYTMCFVLFGLAGTLLLYFILRLQTFLPYFFPQYQTAPLTPDVAANTAISFSTTTTWQAYSGEATMSYFSQMAGLCAQNFLAGAAGLAIGIAFIRGLAGRLSETLGNFWVDLTRALLWVLLPGALIGALLLVWQGVPMNFHNYAVATSVEHSKQVIAQGPVAALEIIKNLGHERWRLFQCQRRSSLRKSHAAYEFSGDAGNCPSAGGLDQHFWQNGRPSSSRLAFVLGHARAFYPRIVVGALLGTARKSSARQGC